MYTVKVHETIIKPHQLPLKPMVHGILPQLDDQKRIWPRWSCTFVWTSSTSRVKYIPRT